MEKLNIALSVLKTDLGRVRQKRSDRCDLFGTLGGISSDDFAAIGELWEVEFLLMAEIKEAEECISTCDRLVSSVSMVQLPI